MEKSLAHRFVAPASCRLIAAPVNRPTLHAEVPRGIQYRLLVTNAEFAAIFKGHEALGVGHLMLHFEPQTPEALKRLAEALRYHRTVLAG